MALTTIIPDPPQDLLSILRRVEEHTSRTVHAPSLVVFGARSAGKRALLKALTGFDFSLATSSSSTAKNQATDQPAATKAGREPRRHASRPQQFPVGLAISRSPGISVAIIPAPDRTSHEKRALDSLPGEIARIARDKGVSVAMREAQTLMSSVSGSGQAACRDLVRFSVGMAGCPVYAVYDLPDLDDAAERIRELTAAAGGGEGGGTVSILVQDATKPHSPLVGKFSDNRNFISVLTRPDLLEDGAAPEQRLASRLASEPWWHVVSTGNNSNNDDDDDDDDELFFRSRQAWARFPPQRRGITALRARVHSLLSQSYRESLAAVAKDIRTARERYKAQLDVLGCQPRRGAGEKMSFLVSASQEFTSIMKRAVDGEHGLSSSSSSSSGDAGSELEAGFRQLIDKRVHEFVCKMRTQGSAHVIVQGKHDEEPWAPGDVRPRIGRAEFTSKVRDELTAPGSRLSGLPTTSIAQTLFSRHSEPWRRIATSLVNSALHDMKALVQSAASRAFPHSPTVFPRLCNHLEGLGLAAQQRVDALADARWCSRWRLAEAMRKASRLVDERAGTQMADAMIRELAKRGFTLGQGNGMYVDSAVMQQVMSTVAMEREREGARTAEVAVCCMDEYYECTLELFIQNVIDQALEPLLVSKLPTLLTPDNAYRMSEEDIDDLLPETAAMDDLRRWLYAARAALKEDLWALEASPFDTSLVDLDLGLWVSRVQGSIAASISPEDLLERPRDQSSLHDVVEQKPRLGDQDHYESAAEEDASEDDASVYDASEYGDAPRGQRQQAPLTPDAAQEPRENRQGDAVATASPQQETKNYRSHQTADEEAVAAAAAAATSTAARDAQKKARCRAQREAKKPGAGSKLRAARVASDSAGEDLGRASAPRASSSSSAAKKSGKQFLKKSPLLPVFGNTSRSARAVNAGPRRERDFSDEATIFLTFSANSAPSGPSPATPRTLFGGKLTEILTDTEPPAAEPPRSDASGARRDPAARYRSKAAPKVSSRGGVQAQSL